MIPIHKAKDLLDDTIILTTNQMGMNPVRIMRGNRGGRNGNVNRVQMRTNGCRNTERRRMTRTRSSRPTGVLRDTWMMGFGFEFGSLKV